MLSRFLCEVVHAFEAGGILAEADAGFRPRAGQQQMAQAVAETIEVGGTLVAEAGTGVGKTFAYLVPAVLSGERVLFSTATKTLQDQLFTRDLPRVCEALGLPVRAALLKGRASYLCQHRLQLARADVPANDLFRARALAQVERWALSTPTGDLAELPGLDERSPLIPLITSTRENCLGAQCPQARECHVNAARRDALAADVVVVNHHLFFADLAVRESGVAELLPSVRVVVFDEAHQLNETGVLFLGRQVGTGQLIDLARDVLAAGRELARGLADWDYAAMQLDRSARTLRQCFGAQAADRLRWTAGQPEGASGDEWRCALAMIDAACANAALALDTVSEIAPDFVRLAERAARISQGFARFTTEPEEGAVRWVEVGLQLRLVESPLDIAATVRSRMLGLDPQIVAPTDTDANFASEGERSRATTLITPSGLDNAASVDASSTFNADRPRSWIFTSATLGDDDRLSWFTEPCGLQDARVLRVKSPFDYAGRAAVYVPTQLPRPSDTSHSRTLASWLVPAITRLGGRTLVLTTTLRALREIGAELSSQLTESAVIEVLVQGEWPKRHLMERFREGNANGRFGTVLVASASFWEGFDVPGDALQLVVIDKLPFPPPGDPLVEARSQRVEHTGKSAFMRYFLPEAAVALKQGAGRLIRGESDRGLLVIGDTRLVSMGYGRRLLAALPPMRRLPDQAAFDQAVEDLITTPSTKADPLL